MASITFDLPAPFGPMTAVKSAKGPAANRGETREFCAFRKSASCELAYHTVSRLLRDGIFNKDITLIDGEKLIASWPKSMN